LFLCFIDCCFENKSTKDGGVLSAIEATISRLELE